MSTERVGSKEKTRSVSKEKTRSSSKQKPSNEHASSKPTPSDEDAPEKVLNQRRGALVIASEAGQAGIIQKSVLHLKGRRSRSKGTHQSDEASIKEDIDGDNSAQQPQIPKNKSFDASATKPRVRIGVMAAIADHPFFKDVSDDFKNEIMPFVVRHRLAVESSSAATAQTPRISDRQGLFSSDFDLRDTSQVRTLIEQGENLPSEFDGLVVTDARFDADLELVYNHHVIQTLHGHAVLGTEVVFGMVQTSVFEVRLRAEGSSPLFVIPHEEFLEVLSQPRFAEDAAVLRERAESTSAGSILQNWFCKNSAKVKIKLFANVSMSFKSRLIQAISVRLHRAGSTIVKEGEASTSCILIFHGEAEVVLHAQHVGELRHEGKHSTAWSGWWGSLEALGIYQRRPADVKAITDCLVWYLESAALTQLREEFPTECGLFDKVAVRHVQLLAPFALDFFHVLLLEKCDPNFLAHLNIMCTSRILMPGEYIVKMDDHGSEMFLLARGKTSVWNGEQFLGNQSEGACFGELAVLGITSKRTCSIVCETICDLRVLSREQLLKALTEFPAEADKLNSAAARHGFSKKAEISSSEDLHSLLSVSTEFFDQLSKLMVPRSWFLGQNIVNVGEASHEMYFITSGMLSFEINGKQCLEVVGPAVICEMALISPGSQAPVTIRCLTLCECFVISSQDGAADHLRTDFPEDIEKIKKKVDQRLDAMAEGCLEDQTEEDASSESKPKLGFSGVFADSDEAFLQQLSMQLERRVFFDGQVMLQEGQQGDYGILINDGKAVVEVDGQRVAEIKNGDFVGEVVLLGFAETYSCTVRALGFVKAFSVKKEQFQQVVVAFPHEKNRLEELMKKRVGLTRALANVKAFCNFVPKDNDYTRRLTAVKTQGASGSAHRGSRMSSIGLFPASDDSKRHSRLGAHLKSDHRKQSHARHSSIHRSNSKQTIQRTSSKERSSAESLIKSAKEHTPEGTKEHKEHRRALSISQHFGSSHIKEEDGSPMSDGHRSPSKRGHSKRNSISRHHDHLPHHLSSTSRVEACQDLISSGKDADAHKASSAQQRSLREIPACMDEVHHEESEGGSETTISKEAGSTRRKVYHGRVQGQLWVTKRKEAIERASWHRNRNLKRVGKVAEVLPPGCSFRLTEEATETSLLSFTQGAESHGSSETARFREATSVYGRPVWHEVFGAPIHLPPITPR